MSDYTSTYTEGTGDTIDTSDFSTEFDAIETAIATKYDDSTNSLRATQIEDQNGNELIKFTTTAAAVNEITYANAATGNRPSMVVSGEDVGFNIEGCILHNATLALTSVDATTLDGDTVTCNTTLNIPAGSIGNTEIATNAVDSAEIATDAVQNKAIDYTATSQGTTTQSTTATVLGAGFYILAVTGATTMLVEMNDGSTWQTVHSLSTGTGASFFADGTNVRIRTAAGTANYSYLSILA